MCVFVFSISNTKYPIKCIGCLFNLIVAFTCCYGVATNFFFFFLAQIENSFAKEPPTTTSGEPTQPQGKSRNNTHFTPNLPHNH